MVETTVINKILSGDKILSGKFKKIFNKIF